MGTATKGSMKIIESLMRDIEELAERDGNLPMTEIRLRCYSALLSLLLAEEKDPDGEDEYRKVRFGVTKALAMVEGVSPNP